MPPDLHNYLNSILGGHLGDFDKLEQDFDRLLVEFSRELPAEVYQELRDLLVSALPSTVKGIKARVKLVVDSNVIVKDAFRVAQGKPSSTERLFSSEFVELWAPSNIADEVHREIGRDLPRGASAAKAEAHADGLLSRVKIAQTAGDDALIRARKSISEESPEDVPFLALAIDTGAEAVVSYDVRAFGAQTEVKRWTMKDTANIVVTYESGTLCFFVVAESVEAVATAASVLVIGILKAVAEILAMILALIKGIMSGAADALAKVPDWAWAVLGVIGIGLLAGLILDEGFRKSVSETLSRSMDVMVQAFDSTIGALKSLWTASSEVIMALWTATTPILDVLVVLVGILLRRIALLFAELMDLTSPNG